MYMLIDNGKVIDGIQLFSPDEVAYEGEDEKYDEWAKECGKKTTEEMDTEEYMNHYAEEWEARGYTVYISTGRSELLVIDEGIKVISQADYEGR